MTEKQRQPIPLGKWTLVGVGVGCLFMTAVHLGAIVRHLGALRAMEATQVCLQAVSIRAEELTPEGRTQEVNHCLEVAAGDW